MIFSLSLSRKIFFPMLKKTLNGLIIVFLMLSYLNRGLYVDTSEADFVYPNHTTEINSVLELILSLTGNPNDIDEDGDSPENYTLFQFSKLLICQDFEQALRLNHLFSKATKKTFYVFSDDLSSSPFYGQIDHPPQG